MKIIEIVDDVTLQQLVRDDPRRSPGLHQSTIVGDIMKKLDPNRFGGIIRPEFIGVGQAFEDLLARELRDSILGWEKPGEFEKDGIIVSPDGIDPAFGPEEIKATWIKGKRGSDALLDPKFLRYHMQGKNTCSVLGSDRIKFRVLFVTGPAYREAIRGGFAPPFPTLRTFAVIYTPREIRDGWNQMLQHAEDEELR